MICPSCKRNLLPSGELTIDGRALTVYQCDDCTRPWQVGGSVFQTLLTFAVDEDGRMLDPDTFEPLHLSPPSLN